MIHEQPFDDDEVRGGISAGDMFYHLQYIGRYGKPERVETLVVVKLYEHFALFINEIGVRECFSYFDISRDFKKLLALDDEVL